MKRLWLPMLFIPLMSIGCVTINIYFPAAAAEKAADKIVDEVWQLREGTGQRPGVNRVTPESSQPANKEPK